ncbi:phosphoribosylglycinamide formyltransferase [bacterium]|nr:phosphoribosylglycinamide formyltransferase [bacterium]
MRRIGVLLSGRGSNFEALARVLKSRQLPAEVVIVISDKADARGIAIAKALNIPTEIIERSPTEDKTTHSKRIQTALEAKNLDLIVMAGFMRILSSEFVSAFSGKIINIHPSLLPAFKGLNAQQQAYDAGVCFSGCTVHYVTAELDGGPIIAQSVVPVLATDTVEKLTARILKEEHRLLPAVVAQIALGNVRMETEFGRSFVQWKSTSWLSSGEWSSSSIRLA